MRAYLYVVVAVNDESLQDEWRGASYTHPALCGVHMDRMVPEPRTFKELIEADLRAARLVIKVQDAIDPQFRIATPEGDCWLAVTLPCESRERMMMLRRISAFMARKKASGFILASELQVPDCVYALGVMGQEVHACSARIARTPKPWTAANFGAVEWMERGQIGQEMIDLLPRSAVGDAGRVLSKIEIAMLEKWFGTEGIYPAVHVESGEVRGV